MEKFLSTFATMAAVAVAGAWIYRTLFYKGSRRRIAGAHRASEHTITMFYATVRPTGDRATWYQVAISGFQPLEAGVL